MNINTYSITNLRQNTSKVLKNAQLKDVVYVVKNSKPEAAIVNVEYLESLQKACEEYLDVLEFDKREKEDVVSWNEYEKKK